jgi:hypothetical protein
MVERHPRQARQSLDPLHTNLDNARNGQIDVIEDDTCWNAYSRDLLRTQERRAVCIRRSRSRTIVRATVDLDRQTSSCTVKVQDVDSCRVLPPEFQAARP